MAKETVVEVRLNYQQPKQLCMDLMSDERKLDYMKYGTRLYKAALRGDWKDAMDIHTCHPTCFQERISKHGDTALHIAAAGGHTNFVKQVLKQAKFTAKQLELQNNAGNTAFCLAAASGAVEIVKEMETRNPQLRYIEGSNNLKPIHMAALLGQKDMVEHLLPCFHHLSPEERIDLLISTINTELYEVSLEILEMDYTLAVARNGNAETPLHTLARKPRNKGQRQQQGYKIFNSMWKPQLDDPGKLKLVRSLWDKVIEHPERAISDILSSPCPGLLFEAIESGNYEFVDILVSCYPDSIWEVDDECRTIFHAAVQYREEKIFGHITELYGISHLLTAYKNPSTGNNILHLAASLPPCNRLNTVSGAALQMQREQLWFQEVKNAVRPELAEGKNYSGQTPQALFSKEHKELKKEGERWMKNTAIAFMLMAILIAAVVSQATLTLPKDVSSLVKSEYAFSLLASAASILTFLAILASRFAEEDFLKSLPLKLMMGLLLLFFSIVAMLFAFTMTCFTVFTGQEGWILMTILAWLIFAFYVYQHLPLLIDVYIFTFRWRNLFQSSGKLF